MTIIDALFARYWSLSGDMQLTLVLGAMTVWVLGAAIRREAVRR